MDSVEEMYSRMINRYQMTSDIAKRHAEEYKHEAEIINEEAKKILRSTPIWKRKERKAAKQDIARAGEKMMLATLHLIDATNDLEVVRKEEQKLSEYKKSKSIRKKSEKNEKNNIPHSKSKKKKSKSHER